jgi:hypothetical protein
MRPLQLKLSSAPAGDDALVVVDELGETVEQCGLAGAVPPETMVLTRQRQESPDLSAFKSDRAELTITVEPELVFRICGW